MLRKYLIYGLFSMFVALGCGTLGTDRALAQNPILDAQIRSGDVHVPNTITTTERPRTVYVEVKNNGTVTWQARKCYLKVFIYRGPSGSPVQRDELAPYLELSATIKPGETHRFEYKIEGTPYAGEYQIDYQMAEVSARRVFGDRIRKNLTVVAAR